MTVENVLLVALIGSIAAIPFLTAWAISSLKRLEESAQKWRIGRP